LHPLARWGFDTGWHAAFAPFAARSLVPARITQQHREHVDVVAEDGEKPAELPGRLFHGATSIADVPVVGDFVALQLSTAGPPVVEAVLPRRTSLLRRNAGRERQIRFRGSDVEAIVANVDLVLVLTSLNSDFSPRRIERFLAQIWEGGAQPVVVLTKADLNPEADARVAATVAVAPGAPVHAVSAVTGDGLDALRTYLAPGRTVALVGSSGVGKSTLLNAVAGTDLQLVRAIREHDDTGVHTTTSRRMFLLPDGACVVDTPGIRELGLHDAEAGVEAAFSDVASLAGSCRFRDCAHAAEPGCAVRAAVESGALAEDRLESYRQLRREIAFTAAKERKRDRAIQRSQPDARRAALERGARPAEE
jgi:ribosome biogenesis GTPase / thiamine phosphate phosphatase